MFKSATVQLTAWYLAILMAISLIFSIAIYQLNFREINVRLENLQRGLLDLDFIDSLGINTDQVRLNQSREASQQMVLTLLYVNSAILIGGGIGSYYLARRTLRPLEKAHDAQSRFTSDASHELRTPLSAMKAELEVALRDPLLDQKEARDLLESNLEEVNKLIALSEMLLKLARLDYDKLDRQFVDVRALLESSLKNFGKEKKRFTIEQTKTAMAYGNEAGIQEVYTILLDNAHKYSKPKSPITIKIHDKRGMTCVAVSNQGTTIPQDKQLRIFERFYRADESRTESGKNGYGLGLAIAKKIVDIHHGDMFLNSHNGKTTFTVQFPNHRSMAARVANTSVSDS